MIIKSMTRKHASFRQLIDYIEDGQKSRSFFRVYHNLYNRDSEQIKAEFSENAKSLKFRKNGVYLYHEVISITRSQHTQEDEQKEALQAIVREYLVRRASRQLAYAVLHEDKKDNLHFHLVISANESGNESRKRLSKAEFSEIQTSLEKWVLETFPQLEQKAVFEKNQTDQQKHEKAQKARISNDGAELKRRGGKTTQRDDMKETIENIFTTSTNGRDFSEKMEQAGLKLYQRGKNYGVTAEDGTKYRFSTLGLAEAWASLNVRMMEKMYQGAEKVQDTVRQTADTILGQQETATKAKQEAKDSQTTEHTKTVQDTEKTAQDTPKNTQKDTQKPDSTAQPLDPVAEEMERRREEMRAKRAKQDTQQASTKNQQKNQP